MEQKPRNAKAKSQSTTKQEKKENGTLWQLFAATFYISACTFGGGFVIVTFMKKKFVDELHWINEEEMLDFTALAQSSPGAIAVNAAILVGLKVKGLPGMAAAVFGTVLPPTAILSLISVFYEAFSSNLLIALALQGMQAGVAAVILDVTWGLGTGVFKEKNIYPAAILIGAFAADFLLGINVIYIILAAAAAGAARGLILKRREADR